jgi:hypothetical protein
MAFTNAKRPASSGDESQPLGFHQAGQRDASSLSHSTPEAQGPRHHCDSPQRRPKTFEELRDGCEFVELCDRAHPGRLSGVPRR